MTDPSENNTAIAHKTPGEMLRAAREKRGFQQSGVAERMRLSVQTIIDIENDDYTRFPAEIYLRGHIRSFSRIVNLDENVVLKCYESMGMVFETGNHVRLLTAQTIPVSTGTRRSKRRALLWVSFTVLLLLVAMVVLWWQEQKSHLFSSLSTVSISRLTNTQTIPITTTNTEINKPLVIAKKATRRTVHHQRARKINSHPTTTTSSTVQKKKVHPISPSHVDFSTFVPDYKIASVQ